MHAWLDRLLPPCRSLPRPSLRHRCSACATVGRVKWSRRSQPCASAAPERRAPCLANGRLHLHRGRRGATGGLFPSYCPVWSFNHSSVSRRLSRVSFRPSSVWRIALRNKPADTAPPPVSTTPTSVDAPQAGRPSAIRINTSALTRTAAPATETHTLASSPAARPCQLRPGGGDLHPASISVWEARSWTSLETLLSSS